MVPPYGIVPDRATRDLQLGHLPGELRIVAQVPNAGQQRLMTKEAEGGQPDGIGCNTGEDRDPSGAGRHRADRDRKSTRLNSSHGYISYAVFCLKKKKKHVCELN